MKAMAPGEAVDTLGDLCRGVGKHPVQPQRKAFPTASRHSVHAVGTSLLAVSRRLSPWRMQYPVPALGGAAWLLLAPGPAGGGSQHVSPPGWARSAVHRAQAQGWVGLLTSSFEVKNPGMRSQAPISHLRCTL